MDPKAETARLLRHLCEVVEGSGLGAREIAARLGLARGDLARILSTPGELEFRQLLTILEVIGYPRDRFFTEVFSPPAGVTERRDGRDDEPRPRRNAKPPR